MVGLIFLIKDFYSGFFLPPLLIYIFCLSNSDHCFPSSFSIRRWWYMLGYFAEQMESNIRCLFNSYFDTGNTSFKLYFVLPTTGQYSGFTISKSYTLRYHTEVDLEGWRHLQRRVRRNMSCIVSQHIIVFCSPTRFTCLPSLLIPFFRT